jgi:hypothetical protein
MVLKRVSNELEKGMKVKRTTKLNDNLKVTQMQKLNM